MPKPITINNHNNLPVHFWKRLAIVIGISLGLVIALAVSPIGGNVSFYSKWVECGQKPVEAAAGYKDTIGWYEESRAIQLVRLQADYFCTPLEAERAGYSASPGQYEFPHLEERN